MSTTRRMGLLILALATGWLSAGPAAAQEGGPTLADLAFMAGCWEGPAGRGTIEEHYTTPSENVMLGTTRYLRDGRAVQFELTIIRTDEEGTTTLLPHPGGRPSEHAFRLTRADGTSAVFEAPEHDFPKRIIYRLDGEELRARIDGGEGSEEVREWVMGRASCGGEGPPLRG